MPMCLKQIKLRSLFEPVNQQSETKLHNEKLQSQCYSAAQVFDESNSPSPYKGYSHSSNPTNRPLEKPETKRRKFGAYQSARRG